MSPLILDAPDRLPVPRGDVVLLIPVFGAHDRFVECLRSVLAHTPAAVALLVVDDASPDDRSWRLLKELERTGVLAHRLWFVRNPENRGFLTTVNDAFRRCDPADVVVLNSDCVVTEGWLEAMIAAGDRSLVATVSVFTNHGTILSLPHRNRALPTLPQTLSVDVAARKVKSQSLGIRPRLPTAIGHCFLVKRTALDLVGPFDEAFSPGYGEEVDFSQRCVQRGLVHVLADDAFVMHTGSASFDPEARGNDLQRVHDQMIDARYNYYQDWIDSFSDPSASPSPFSRAIGAAQRALRSFTVTIDARCLGPIVTGTQVHTLEVIAALSHEGGVELRAAVPADLGHYARAVLAELDNVELVPTAGSGAGMARSDIVHRPMQVSELGDLELLERLGERIVITQQDLIGYHNPSYYRTFSAWADYRRLTRLALSYADRVVFFSRSAAAEAIDEELVSQDLVDVVYIGTDHAIEQVPAHERAPDGMDALEGRPFLLCLGTDFSHKNRVFALRVLESLRRNHGFAGGLVFAGPHVPIGSSAADEAEYIAKHPSLRSSVVDLAAVDEGEKRWLLRLATLVLYPSVHEGFGLVPFEAAEAGVACAFASHTSVAELLPRKLAMIVQWDPDATAKQLMSYIESGPMRAQHVAAVKASAARFTWRSTARGLLDVYRKATSERASGSRKLVEDCIVQQHERDRATDQLRELEGHYFELRGQYDKTAQGLVGPGGVIPVDLRRPLLAIGSRPALRRTTFALLRAGYAAGYRARHAGRAPGD